MSFLLPYWSALLLGSAHALEADHMAAVTSFAVRKPTPRAAMRFGVQWAIGHGAVVIAAGAALLLIGLVIPEVATTWLEKIVGVVLIGLGASTVIHAQRLHVHADRGARHAHLHSHPLPAGREHSHESHAGRWSHAPAAIGALHGLAGAAPAVALLQVTAMESITSGMLYLMMFAVGTAVGMAAYAAVTGFVAGRAALASERAARAIGKISGVATIAIGVFWMLR